MKNAWPALIRWLASPWTCWLAVCGLGGILLGLGLFVLLISRAPSYLSNAPETCINCHVMTDAYLSWQHSAHAQTASCNDCHVPQENLFRSYWFKAEDGLRHAAIFTFRLEPEVIQLSERAKPVVQANCRRCHQRVLELLCLSYAEQASTEGSPVGSQAIKATAIPPPAKEPERFCWDCHRHTPHDRVHSLSGTPDVFRPRLPLPIRWKQQPTITQRRVRGRAVPVLPPEKNP